MFLCVSLQADAKLREEEKRALRYLETRRECNSVQAVSVFKRNRSSFTVLNVCFQTVPSSAHVIFSVLMQNIITEPDCALHMTPR